jgi:hypothetical protein
LRGGKKSSGHKVAGDANIRISWDLDGTANGGSLMVAADQVLAGLQAQAPDTGGAITA